MGAHPPQDDGLSPLIAQLCPLHLEPAVLRHAAPRCFGGLGDLGPRVLGGGRITPLPRPGQLHGLLEEDARLRPGQPLLGVEIALIVPLDDAGGVGGQHRLIVPPLQPGEILHLPGLGVVVPPDLREEGPHQDLDGQLAGDGLVKPLPGGRDLVPVVPPGLEGRLELASGPVVRLSRDRAQPGAPGGHRHKLGRRDGRARPEGAVWIAVEDTGLLHLGHRLGVPCPRPHVRKGGGGRSRQQQGAQTGPSQYLEFSHTCPSPLREWTISAQARNSSSSVLQISYSDREGRPMETPSLR